MCSVEKLVQKQLDFYNANDLQGFASMYHEEVEIYNLEDHSLILKGKEALKIKYFERFEVQRVKAELINRMVIGNKVIDHEHVTGIKQGEIVKAVAIYQVEDQAIRRVWFMHE